MPTAGCIMSEPTIRCCIFVPFENRSSSVVKIYLSEEFQALDQDDSEILIKNGWLTVAGGAINRVPKSKILQPWRSDRHASVLFPFITIAVMCARHELKTNRLRRKIFKLELLLF